MRCSFYPEDCRNRFTPTYFDFRRWIRITMAMGLHRITFAKRIFLRFGFLAVRDQYYQPLINPAKHLHKLLNQEQSLPGINFNDDAQLELSIKNWHHLRLKKPKTPDFTTTMNHK